MISDWFSRARYLQRLREILCTDKRAEARFTNVQGLVNLKNAGGPLCKAARWITASIAMSLRVCRRAKLKKALKRQRRQYIF